MSKRERCPICGAGGTTLIEYRPETPVLMNKLYATSQAARAAIRGTLHIVACATCGFAWNKTFDPELIVYDSDYENDQTHSDTFLVHMNARASAVVDTIASGAPIDYLEIGCGQGRFITAVADAAGSRLRSAEGFDPAWRGADATGPNGSRIHKVCFTPETYGRVSHSPNLIVSRHTIEHVPEPVTFLNTIRTALGPGSRARIFIETPCIAWILQHQAMQDLFYEHCSIFTSDSLLYALEQSGFGEVEVCNVFGGQYLWATGTAGPGHTPRPLKTDENAPSASGQVQFIERWRDQIVAAHKIGLIAIWGAGAKGTTFALLNDPNATIFEFAIDINPAKQGLYMAGTGLPVVAPAEMAKRSPSTVFVMNPNYLSEIATVLKEYGIHAKLIPIN